MKYEVIVNVYREVCKIRERREHEAKEIREAQKKRVADDVRQEIQRLRTQVALDEKQVADGYERAVIFDTSAWAQRQEAESHQFLQLLQRVGKFFYSFQWSKFNEIDQHMIWHFLNELILASKDFLTSIEIEIIQESLKRIQQQSSLNGLKVYKELIKRADNSQFSIYLSKLIQYACAEIVRGQYDEEAFELILSTLPRLDSPYTLLLIPQIEKTIRKLSDNQLMEKMYFFLAQLYFHSHPKKNKVSFESYLPLSSAAFRASIQCFLQREPNIKKFAQNYIELEQKLPLPLRNIFFDQLYYALEEKMSFSELNILAEDKKLSVHARTLLCEFVFMHRDTAHYALLIQWMSREILEQYGELTTENLEEFFIMQDKFVSFRRLFRYYSPAFRYDEPLFPWPSLPLSTQDLPSLSLVEYKKLYDAAQKIPALSVLFRKNFPSGSLAVQSTTPLLVSEFKKTIPIVETLSPEQLKAYEKAFDLHMKNHDYQNAQSVLTELSAYQNQDQIVVRWKNRITAGIASDQEKFQRIVASRKDPHINLEKINACLRETAQLLRFPPKDLAWYSQITYEDIVLKIMRIEKENNLCISDFDQHLETYTTVINLTMLDDLRVKLKEIIDIHPHKAEPHYTLGYIHHFSARALWIFLLTQSFSEEKRLRLIYIIRTHYELAAQHFQKITTDDEMYFRANWYIADAYFQLKKYEQTEAHCQLLLQIQPENAEVLLRLSLLYFTSERYTESHRVIQQLILLLESSNITEIETKLKTYATRESMYIFAAKIAQTCHNELSFDVSQVISYLIKAKEEFQTMPHADCLDYNIIIGYEGDDVFYDNLMKSVGAPALIMSHKEYYFRDYDPATGCTGSRIKIGKLHSILAEYMLPSLSLPKQIMTISSAAIGFAKLTRALLNVLGTRSAYFQKIRKDTLDYIEDEILKIEETTAEETPLERVNPMMLTYRRHRLFTIPEEMLTSEDLPAASIDAPSDSVIISGIS